MNRTALVLRLLLYFSALINVARAEDKSFLDQFVGGPLLILAALVVIDIIALAYRKLRK